MPLRSCLDHTTESYYRILLFTNLSILSYFNGTKKISFIFNHLIAKNGVLGRTMSQGMFYVGISLHRYSVFHCLPVLPLLTTVATEYSHSKSVPVVHNTYNPDTGYYFSKATQDSYLLEDICKLLIYNAENSKTDTLPSVMPKIRPFLCTDI